MKEKAHFTKEYERDVGLVFEGLWASNLAHFIPKRLHVDPPHTPFSAFYTTDESLEIWENKKAIQWLRDFLLEKNKQGTAFIEGVVSEYTELLVQIKKYWEAGPTNDKKALTAYMEFVKPASLLFSLWYYPVSDERTPADVNEIIVPLRTDDAFFGKNDVFLKECVALLGGNKRLANLVFPNEFPNIPDDNVLRYRAQGTVTVDGGEYLTMPLETFAAQHPEYVFEGLTDAHKEASEFSGKSAFKGVVRGKAVIVKNKFQMEGVRAGDILVSPMTTPDFLSAMERAAAFITDEGGIICHAAIVARELKKPCIIGTKIATKVLKDGDVVEVDAERGIVRIIKKANG